MAHIARNVEKIGEQVASFSVRRKWLALILSLLVLIAGGFGASKLGMSGDYQIYFSDENPELKAFLNFEASYGKADNISFVVIPKEGDIYQPRVIEAVHKITTKAWNIPYVSRVDSLTNFQHTYAVGDELIVEDLVYDPSEVNDSASLEKIQEIARNEPLLHNFVTADNDGATIINTIVQVDRSDMALINQTVANAREIRSDILSEYPEIDIHLTGALMLSASFSEVAMADSQTLIPAMYGLIIVVMLLVIRSASATFATLLLIMFSTIFGMGIGGWLGIKLTPISITAPTIILVIAVADAVHIIAAFRQRMRRGMEKSAAIIEATAANAFPVTITSLTTIVGFLSLNFSDAPPFHHLGNITAAGILMAWFLSLVFLPAMLRLLPAKYKPVTQGAKHQGVMLKLADWVLARRRAVFGFTMLFCLAAITMIPKIEFNDVWSKYFDTRVPVRQAIDATQPYFGTDTMEFILDAGEPGDVLKPAFLQDVATFTDWLQARDEVRHVYSLSHIMKRLNKNLNADDPAYYRIPENQKKASQYLLVYELSLPYGLDLNDRIDIDRENTRVSVTLKDLSTAESRAFSEAAVEWVNANSSSGVTAHSTGTVPMFNYITERNLQSMMEGAIFLVIAIFIIMAISFKSIEIGFLSVLLNAIPILATFGIWAVLVGEVGFSIAIVGPVAVGLVVDDCVHIISKYMVARRHRRASFNESVRYAFDTAGVAIASTTVILGAGFALLATSAFKPNEDMGLMTAIAIFLAMAVSFLAMPGLLHFMNRHKGE